MNRSMLAWALATSLMMPAASAAQTVADTIGYTADACPPCANWNSPVKPFRIDGNVYYVGTRELSALLITSPTGHVLIDGGLPNSAAQIIRNIRELGFREHDVKRILNSHVHYDHAGGLAALQRITGAVVAASAKSAPVLRSGKVGTDDPQHGIALPMPPVARVQSFNDGDTLRVGSLVLVAHLTPGHTPGGTSWTWRSCTVGRCIDFVYADSQTPISDSTFTFSRNARYPTVLEDYEKGLAELESMSCDILVTPHPGASDLWSRLQGTGGAKLIDRSACKRYAQRARRALAQRLSAENAR